MMFISMMLFGVFIGVLVYCYCRWKFGVDQDVLESARALLDEGPKVADRPKYINVPPNPEPTISQIVKSPQLNLPARPDYHESMACHREGHIQAMRRRGVIE